MAGNIWEWTRSTFAPYPYDTTDGREEEREPQNKRFTLRGGGWLDQPANLRASFRLGNSPDDDNIDVGFRLARHLKL